ncbi:hypothetical protein [Marinobacter aromaticivorans]|uniref:Alginate export domain-containing protein n=1 Tax=Marinobacter aromaticivorans TaxID=1494078 RepID=A0ABW2IRL5_9GAMM|nr:hypothetical protein [Marinobacter aromaticivorans]
MTHSWWTLVDRIRCRNSIALTCCLAVPLLVFSSASHGLEPVFEIVEDSITERLKPEKLPLSFYTFEPGERWAEPLDSYWLDFSNFIMLQERIQGPKVQSLGQWADRTLSGEIHDLPRNDSYLRLGFATESEYGNPAQFEPEARFRLDIPTTKRKLRLVIESESDELIPLEERQRDRQLTEPERTSGQATGAFRYLSQIGDAINLSNDIGARLHFPPDAFWRATAERYWKLDDDWGLRAQQRFYYYHQDGWGARSWLNVGRGIGNGWHFWSSSELEWVHRDSKFVAAHIFTTSKRLNNRSVLSPRVGVLGESKPGWRTTSAFADLTWRYRLHSDWLFAELIPALTFPRDESFKDRGSLIFRIEMYFSGSINPDF